MILRAFIMLRGIGCPPFREPNLRAFRARSASQLDCGQAWNGQAGTSTAEQVLRRVADARRRLRLHNACRPNRCQYAEYTDLTSKTQFATGTVRLQQP